MTASQERTANAARRTRGRRLAIALTALTLLVPCAAAAQDNRYSAIICLARVKRDAGDMPSARRYFEDARRIHALNVAELAEYFWVVVSLDGRQGLVVGQSVLQASPADADVRDRMIAAAIALEDESTVLALASQGQKVKPTLARWPRRLAESHLRSQHPAEAALAYEQAVHGEGAVEADRVGLAVAKEAAGAYPDAAAVWDTLPASAWSGNAEWAASRLRALAHAAPAAAAPELDARFAEAEAEAEAAAAKKL